MTCLAPQFKWPSSTSHLQPRTAFREPGCSFRSRIHCAVSSSAAVEVERPEPSVAGVAWPPSAANSTLPTNFGAALASEALLNEEAVVAAAATEAVALARAAAEVAGEVARMVKNDHRPTTVRRDPAESFLTREILRTEMEEETSSVTQHGHVDEDAEFCGIFSDESDVGDDEQYTHSIAVKSSRQLERRARRARAATKAARAVSPPKPATSSRKKRLKGCRNPLGCFYKMSGRRLLTAKQEIEFSKGIQDLLKLEAIQRELEEYNAGAPTFSQWAAAAGIDENTLRRRLDHGLHCKNRMVTSNVRLVMSIAREFEGPGMEYSDLIQEGMQGLVRGAEKFDASKGFRFSTYSHWWIKQAIRKSVSEQTQIIRLPAHMIEASSRVKECRRRLCRQLKRLPTAEEIAIDTGIPIKRVKAAVNLPKYSVSLTSKVGCTDMTYQEIMPDTSADTAEEILNKWLMKKDVNSALDSLNDRERQVIRWRFGMEDGRLRTLHDIGVLMGVSRERIRQIEMGALRKLRNKKRMKSLQHYLEPVESW